MTFDRLPPELKALTQWVCWRYEEVPGNKPTKVPVNPRSPTWPASVTDPQSWATFEVAVGAFQQSNGALAGIGFVFTERDAYCGIDLDHLENDPEGGARQQFIFQRMDSYSERSPSGMGLHIIVKAQVPHGRKRHGVEVYSSGRFFTMTGDVFHDAPINDRQELVQLLWSEMGAQAQPSHYAGDYTEHHTDQEIYESASRARNGDLFLRLWGGDTSGYFSASEADFALIDIIAFYTKHRGQIQRLFMASELGKREKYANAKPSRLSTLLGYMVNKSFDLMLPPVDLSGVIDEFNAALKAQQGAVPAPVGADQTAQSPVVTADLPTPPGNPSEMWRTVRPPGLLGHLVNYIMAASPRPVYEISLAGALGLMAGITGRAYNVSGTGLNHYIMMLAATGVGKEAMASTTSRLMSKVAGEYPSAQEFIGPAEIASGQALLKHMSERGSPCFVSLVGEIGLRLQQMTHPNASTSDIALRRVMLDLFNKSGAGQAVRPTIYSDKKNNTDVVHSPAFSILGDTTPEAFYKALDEDTIIQGLLPRFTIIEYTGPRVGLNEGHASVVPSDELVAHVASLAKTATENMASHRVIDVQFTQEAQELLRQLDKDTDARINASDKDVLRQLWNRFHLKTMKLAGLLAVAHNHYEPVIDGDMVRWSQSLVYADITRLLTKFVAGEIGVLNDNVEQDKDIKLAVKQYLTTDYAGLKTYSINAALHNDKVIPYFFLQRRLVAMPSYKRDKRNATLAVKSAIQNLIDAGQLQEVPPAQLREKYQFNGRAYIANHVEWFLKS